MKWRAQSQALKPRTYEIEYDPLVGFYLYVFKNGKCTHDYLQDTLELTKEYALKDFGVPKNIWKRFSITLSLIKSQK